MIERFLGEDQCCGRETVTNTIEAAHVILWLCFRIAVMVRPLTHKTRQRTERTETSLIGLGPTSR